MKSIYGLLLAGALGFAALLVNFAYLNQKSKDVEKIYFIGVQRTDASGREMVIARGETLRASDLVPVGVPARWVGDLADFAVLYSARNTVVGEPVWRTLHGGAILLHEDLKTPPPHQLDQAEDEYAWSVPVDGRAVVTSLLVPGDYVWFWVSRSDVPTAVGPRPSSPDDAFDSDDGSTDLTPIAEQPRRAAPAGPMEQIGPFRVLSVGNRLTSAEVHRAARIPQMQENLLTVAVKFNPTTNEVEPKAQKLAALLQSGGTQRAIVLLHPRKKTPS